mgnify:CR=1 FL=1
MGCRRVPRSRARRRDDGERGGAGAGAARADVDNLLYATAEGETLRLRVANELHAWLLSRGLAAGKYHGKLRHSRLTGVRTDKSPREVVRES